MSELCTDNRFELIEKYKAELIEKTNIEMAQDEMAVIDNVLFRFWQMGWLDKLDADAVPEDEYRELLKAARKMHLWIFLNTADEEKAYEECELTDEMNALLGYSGSFVINDDPYLYPNHGGVEDDGMDS